MKTQYIDDPASIADHEAHTILKDLAWSEYRAGHIEVAKKYAEELLRLNKVVERNWNYGNAIHHSHTILGLVCFDEGKLEEAKNHLIKSSKTPGSPQLDTFGPSFDMAKRLIAAGENKTVIKFLENCKKFWEYDKGKLTFWIAEIESGEMPRLER